MKVCWCQISTYSPVIQFFFLPRISFNHSDKKKKHLPPPKKNKKNKNKTKTKPKQTNEKTKRTTHKASLG